MGNDPCVTALPGNKVIISGGIWGYETKPLTYIYDFTLGTWSPGPNLIQKRRLHGCGSITLADGSAVLVIAGGLAKHFCKFLAYYL